MSISLHSSNRTFHVEWGERLHHTDASFLSKIIWILFGFSDEGRPPRHQTVWSSKCFSHIYPCCCCLYTHIRAPQTGLGSPPYPPPPLPDVNRDTTRPAPAADAPIHSSFASIKFSVLIFFNSLAFFLKAANVPPWSEHHRVRLV